MKLQDWIKILYEYGPFAILVFLVIVPERRIRTAMKEASEADRKSLRWVYILNWVAVFGLAIFSVYAWSRLNLTEQPTIRGTIENVSNLETLSTNFEDLYLHRIRQNNDLYSNYEWILLNKDKRMDEGEVIEFTIDGSTINHDHTFDYELPIHTDFYAKKVHLKRDKDDLYLAGQDKPLHKTIRLIEQASPDATSRLQPSAGFFPTAYAQMAQQSYSVRDYAVGLESPDPIVRRNARAALANQDLSKALPWIDEVLADKQSSYRLRLGVIVALENMPGLSASSLPPATVSAIQSTALTESDATLRNEALNLGKKYDLIPLTVYEDFNYAGRWQAFGPGRYRADKRQFGNLPNDSASSVHVGKGYRARLCASEGSGNGAGKCLLLGDGWVQLRSAKEGGLGDQISFIEVTKASTQMLIQSKKSKF